MSEGTKAYQSAHDCKVCGEVTDCSFNVLLRRVNVCDMCATMITQQQVAWWCIREEELKHDV